MMTTPQTYPTGDARVVAAVAWAYPGLTTPGTAALARRVGQVARGFARAGWDVNVIYPDHTCLTDTRVTVSRERLGEGVEVRLIGVSGPELQPLTSSSPLRVARRIDTLRHALFNGDRSGRWAMSALRALSAHEALRRPDLILGFFTPRGPLALASALHVQTGAPWMADLQDETLEGCGRSLRPIVSRWMSRTLASAAHVVQVSPEWAKSDSALLGRRVEVLRHAVPAPRGERHSANASAGEYTLLYAGSIAPAQQNPQPLVEAMGRINTAAGKTRGSRVVLEVAGPRESFNAFASVAAANGIANSVRELGWVEPNALADRMHVVNALVLVPWSAPNRQVIPSKLFDYAATATPILIAGPDSGGLQSLFAEWGHDDVTCASSTQIESALSRAIKGDCGGLLRPNEAARLFGEEQLVAQYCEWADSLSPGGAVYAANLQR